MDGGLSSFVDDNMIRAACLLLAAVAVFLVHELGHYIAARLCDVHVDNVTIGFGREIWRRTDRRGTLWSIRIYPFCGMVHVAQRGRDDAAQKGSFCAQSVKKRFIVIAAGPMANLFFSWIVLSAFFMGIGQPSTPAFVTGIETNSPGERAGLQPGDKIVAFNNHPVTRFDDIFPVTKAVTGVPLAFLIERDGKKIETHAISEMVSYKDRHGFAHERGRIGVLGFHQPIALTALRHVNNHDTDKNADRARTLLLENMDRDIIIGIKSIEDNAVHDYKVNISSLLNEGLRDPESHDFGMVYLGRMKDNFYWKQGRVASMAAGLSETKRLILGVASAAGRLGGTDPGVVKPLARVSAETAFWQHHLHALIWMMAALSVCIALMNCLPVPGFDGSYMLACLTEAALGPAKAALVQPYALRIALLGLVWICMVINLDSLNLLLKSGS